MALLIDFAHNPPHTWAMTYTVQDAQANLNQLLAEAEAGKHVVIEREGRPSIRLAVVDATVAAPPRKERVLGQLRGLVEYDDSAFDPLTDKELAEYGLGFMLGKKLVSEEIPGNKAG